jgi:uncharacterized protein HemX
MNIPFQSGHSIHPRNPACGPSVPPGRRRQSERGSAVLIILALLVIMVALAVGNNLALGHLQRELQLTERRQQQRLKVTATRDAGRTATTGGPSRDRPDSAPEK